MENSSKDVHTSASFSLPLRDACSVSMPGIYTQTNRLENLTNNAHKRKGDTQQRPDEERGWETCSGCERPVGGACQPLPPAQTNPAPAVLESQLIQREQGMCCTHTHTLLVICKLSVWEPLLLHCRWTRTSAPNIHTLASHSQLFTIKIIIGAYITINKIQTILINSFKKEEKKGKKKRKIKKYI